MHAPTRAGARERVRITPSGVGPRPDAPPPPRQATSPTRRPERPIGISLLVIVFAIFAVFGFIAAVAIFLESASIAASEPGFGAITVAIGVVVLILSLLSAAVASGLYRGDRWSWYGALALATMSMVVNVANIVAGALVVSGLGILVAGLVVWNLMRADTRAWLGVTASDARRIGRPV